MALQSISPIVFCDYFLRVFITAIIAVTKNILNVGNVTRIVIHIDLPKLSQSGRPPASAAGMLAANTALARQSNNAAALIHNNFCRFMRLYCSNLF